MRYINLRFTYLLTYLLTLYFVAVVTFFFFFFFLAYSQRSKIGCLPYFYTWCGLKCAARGSLEMQDPKNRQNTPSGHHRTTLSGYASQLRHVSTIGKNLLNSNAFSTYHDNVVNFGPPTGRLRSVGEFGALQQISTGFASWQRYCTSL